MCSYPPENFSSSFSSNRFLCSSFDSVSFLLPRERASELREAISKEALFFLFLVESSNYRVFHAHTYVAGPRAIMLLLRAPRYEGTAMRQSLTKGTPHGTGSVHIAASSWHAALNLIQFYAVWPFFIYEYFSQNRIFDDFQLPAKKTTLVISKPKKTTKENNPSNYLPRYDVIRARS